MKRRARRAVVISIATAATLASILVFAYWDSVRDHVEAWHFQLTRKTATIDPFSVKPSRVNEDGVFVFECPGLEVLAANAMRSIIVDPAEARDVPLRVVHRRLGEDEVVRVLREEGYRVLEQRLPQRAYVAIRAAGKRVHYGRFGLDARRVSE
jgi:hypothetical protein